MYSNALPNNSLSLSLSLKPYAQVSEGHPLNPNRNVHMATLLTMTSTKIMTRTANSLFLFSQSKWQKTTFTNLGLLICNSCVIAVCAKRVKRCHRLGVFCCHRELESLGGLYKGSFFCSSFTAGYIQSLSLFLQQEYRLHIYH